MSKLSKPQMDIIKTFDSWKNCQVEEFADHTRKKVGYALVFWMVRGKQKWTYPNPRTVRALIQRNILVRVPTEGGQIIYKLAPEWVQKSARQKAEETNG